MLDTTSRGIWARTVSVLGSSKITPYALALASVAAMTYVRMLLDPWFRDSSPFVTYLVATLVSAAFGGMKPAFVALITGYFAAAYFFCEPRGSIAMRLPHVQVSMGVYMLIGVAIIGISEAMHAARRRAEAARNQLEWETRNRIEAQLARTELLQRLVNVQEDERRGIARELHDQCGQELTALLLGLRALLERRDSTNLTSRIEELSRIVEKLSAEIHDLTLMVRPTVLDDFGLDSAIVSLTETWSKRTGIPVDCDCRGFTEERLPQPIETALYRTIQEALTNVAKHSETPRVAVCVEQKPGLVQAIVEDQGKGFDLDAVRRIRPDRLGIVSMRERMESVHGSLEIESTVGSGTTVFARVELATPEN
jgi:two-component system sensor histidine kinase NreB